jgi:hypothetical protein
MNEYEFKSHKKSKKNALVHVVADNTKKRLHNLAIKAIVQDNLPFGVFHKKGNNFQVAQCIIKSLNELIW